MLGDSEKDFIYNLSSSKAISPASWSSSDWENEGNIEMVEYLLGLPGIIDPLMGDGTTALAVALATQTPEPP